MPQAPVCAVFDVAYTIRQVQAADAGKSVPTSLPRLQSSAEAFSQPSIHLAVTLPTGEYACQQACPNFEHIRLTMQLAMHHAITPAGLACSQKHAVHLLHHMQESTSGGGSGAAHQQAGACASLAQASAHQWLHRSVIQAANTC